MQARPTKTFHPSRMSLSVLFTATRSHTLSKCICGAEVGAHGSESVSIRRDDVRADRRTRVQHLLSHVGGAHSFCVVTRLTSVNSISATMGFSTTVTLLLAACVPRGKLD